MHINDDLLNKYIDNEISGEELARLTEHINSCNDCLNRLKALRVVDRQLRKLDTYSVPESFTAMMMQKINSGAYQFMPKKSYFFRFVASAFALLIVSVLILIVLLIPEGTFTPPQGQSWIETASEGVLDTISTYSGYLKSRNASVIGSVLTVMLLITGFYIYDSHRGVKNKG